MSATAERTPAVQVTEHIAAPPELVYDLVADVPRMGEWSPECRRCEWLDGATVAKPGAKFRGHNRHGPFRWTTTSTVLRAERGREFSFAVRTVFGLPVSEWRYELRPVEGGCDAVESMIDRRSPFVRVLGRVGTGVRDRLAANEAGMRQTLQQLKRTAEYTAGSR